MLPPPHRNCDTSRTLLCTERNLPRTAPSLAVHRPRRRNNSAGLCAARCFHPINSARRTCCRHNSRPPRSDQHRALLDRDHRHQREKSACTLRRSIPSPQRLKKKRPQLAGARTERRARPGRHATRMKRTVNVRAARALRRRGHACAGKDADPPRSKRPAQSRALLRRHRHRQLALVDVREAIKVAQQPRLGRALRRVLLKEVPRKARAGALQGRGVHGAVRELVRRARKDGALQRARHLHRRAQVVAMWRGQ